MFQFPKVEITILIFSKIYHFNFDIEFVLNCINIIFIVKVLILKYFTSFLLSEKVKKKHDILH